MGRIRLLFFGGMALMALATFAIIADTPSSTTSRVAATVSVFAWMAWGLYRYRRPDAHVAFDLVALVAFVGIGLGIDSAVSLYGPIFLSLYYRAMFGGRHEVVTNALGFFVVFQVVVLVTEGVGGIDVPGAAVLLFLVVAIAAIMQALGQVAVEHERTVARERVLTEVSEGLLRATAPGGVYRAAVEGAVALVGGPESSTCVTLWAGEDVLQLVGSAGGDDVELPDELALSKTPQTFVARLRAGRPFLVDRTTRKQLQGVCGPAAGFQQLLIAPLDIDGERMGLMAIASPLSLPADLVGLMQRFGNEISLAHARAELFEQLQTANQELRDANAAKDRFISAVSHELRTPLTSIRGFAATLRHRGDTISARERDRYLAIIERQTLLQERLVEDLLTTSRMLAGRLPVSPATVTVAQVIDDAVEILNIRQDDIVIDCADDLEVVVDPHHLCQILTNLLSNAVKYGAAPYAISASEVRQHGVITVSDGGTGVPQSFRDRMFEAFEQADGSDARPSRGVGLGLSIVKNLLAANGGSIRYLDDGPLPGACFEVRLPGEDYRGDDGTPGDGASSSVATAAAQGGLIVVS